MAAQVTIALKDDANNEWYSFMLSPSEEERLAQDPEFASLLLNSAKKNKINEGELRTIQDQPNLPQDECHTDIEPINADASIPPDQSDPSSSHGGLDIISEVPVEEEEEKFTWSYQSVQALIALFRQHKEKFESPELKKKNVWREISKKMQEDHGFVISAEQCDKKWRNLRATYKTVLNKKSRKNNHKKMWEFFIDMHDIYMDENSNEDLSVLNNASLVACSPSNPVSIAPAPMKMPTGQVYVIHSNGSTSPNNLLKRTLHDYSSSSSGGNRKRKTNEEVLMSPSAGNVSTSLEPPWFVQFKLEMRKENERNMQELKTMHQENIKLLQDRNEILKGLVSFLQSSKQSEDQKERSFE